MTSVVLGSRRLEHRGMLRTDEVIKEIFGWEKGMASAFRMIMIAYNGMSLFRRKVMINSQAKRLQTIKFQCIAIGSYLVKGGRNTKLKLAAESKRRHFLEHFFSNLEVLDSPFQFSNA
jgi:hypothetical protein